MKEYENIRIEFMEFKEADIMSASANDEKLFEDDFFGADGLGGSSIWKV